MFYNEKVNDITPICKGRIYEYHESHLANYEGNITFVKQLKLRKDLSCEGCEHCGWVGEEIYNNEGFLDFALEDYPYKPGQLYRLTGTSSRSYEGEYDVEYSLEEYEIVTKLKPLAVVKG